MKQDSTRWGDVEALEDFGIQKRQRHHFLELLDVVIKTADRIEVYVW